MWRGLSKDPVRLFIVASLALCLFGMGLSAVQAAGTVKVKYASNIRSGPGTTYSVVGSASPGDVFAIHGESGKWIKIGSGRWIAGWLTNRCYEPSQVCEAIGG